MIKCNVSVCGTVSKAAVVRNGKDGMPFTTYSVDVVVPAKSGINKTVIVSCIMDGDDSAQRLLQALNAALTELGNADAFETYDDLPELECAIKSLAAANTAAIPVKWWTAVTVSKVLHRRRPHIVPLIDSRIKEFYGAKRPDSVRQALWEDIRENVDWLGELAATKRTPDGHRLSLLRLADILIWTP